MEDEVQYHTVTFTENTVSTQEIPHKLMTTVYDEVKTEKTSVTTALFAEKHDNVEIIYDEVKTNEQTPVTTEDEGKAPVHILLILVTAGLGIICIILVSVIVALAVHSECEQSSGNTEPTAQNLQRQTEELIRERDRLNWTIGVILEYETFPVNTSCPQKVCKRCLDDWVPFQSKCYQFSKSNYTSQWRDWQSSRDYCRAEKADLVVVESLEEQEFINNHTKWYNTNKHGYWIGLSNNNTRNSWMWTDGKNVAVTYWTQTTGFPVSCALSLPGGDPLANWEKSSCNMKNRWICERRALVKFD